MQKEILNQIIEQSKSDCSRIFSKINNENVKFRLINETASVGFTYRHIGEITNSLANFFSYEIDIENTTLGQIDDDKDYDIEISNHLFQQAYTRLEKLVNDIPDEDWLQEIETTWFGKISRIKLLSMTLFHNSHHCGQIASALVKGKIF